MRRLVCDLFDAEGYLVSEAANGEQALQQLKSDRPDIVVVDLMMPLMDGLEFVAKCREIQECAEVPIIVMSAVDEALHAATELLGAGIKGCLAKPFSIHDLLEMVERHAGPTATASC